MTDARQLSLDQLALSSTAQRVIAWAFMKAANPYTLAEKGVDTTVEDKELAHQVNMVMSLLPSGMPYWQWRETLIVEMEAMVAAGTLLRVTPAPLSGGTYRWRLAVAGMTLKQAADELLESDCADLMEQFTPSMFEMVYYAACYGPWDDRPLHDGKRFIGDAAKLVQLDLVENNLPRAINQTVCQLKDTPRGHAFVWVLKDSSYNPRPMPWQR